MVPATYRRLTLAHDRVDRVTAQGGGVESPSPTTHRAGALPVAHPAAELSPSVVLDVDGVAMHDPRTSTALRQLTDLGQGADPPRWHWGIARLEATGRFVLPAEARTALGAIPGKSTPVRAAGSRVALVLRTTGAGAALAVDGRGRLRLPVRPRRASDRRRAGRRRGRRARELLRLRPHGGRQPAVQSRGLPSGHGDTGRHTPTALTRSDRASTGFRARRRRGRSP